MKTTFVIKCEVKLTVHNSRSRPPPVRVVVVVVVVAAPLAVPVGGLSVPCTSDYQLFLTPTQLTSRGGGGSGSEGQEGEEAEEEGGGEAGQDGEGGAVEVEAAARSENS